MLEIISILGHERKQVHRQGLSQDLETGFVETDANKLVIETFWGISFLREDNMILR